MTTNTRKNALCNTCTLKLVSIAYRRAPGSPVRARPQTRHALPFFPFIA